MKLVRHLILYSILMVSFGGLIFVLLRMGGPAGLRDVQSAIPARKAHDSVLFTGLFQHQMLEALPRLLLQIIVIITSTQLLGFIFKKIGQPAVVGEIVAGIILGPSLLGWIFPGLFHFIFPVESLPILHFLSQIGLVLFMFIIGMELDTKLLKKQAIEAVIISHAGILIPFTLGIFLSFYLYPAYAHTEFYAFALFMGIAMSITAFPVLARIIRDRKLTDTPLGTLAIGCAASDDVTAWCILAILIGLIRSGSGVKGVYVIGLLLIYILVMLVPVSILLKKIQSIFERGKMGYPGLTFILFTVLLLSSWCTEVIGIHALFGAFLAGIIVPQNKQLQKKMMGRIGNLTLAILLPLFFVYTGLRTQAGILNTSALWASFGYILICAIGGKFGGTALVARALGQTWRNSLSMGALMNTRGLMELVVLNIGYDMGILSKEIFSMMVLMALLTTMMTSPVLDWIAEKKN